MKMISPDLLRILRSREFFAADLYTFMDGNLGPLVLRFTGGDSTIVANGFTYPAGGATGPYFDRKDNKTITWTLGTEVATLNFDVIPARSTLFGVSFQTAARYGFFDGATFMLERAFMPTYGDTRAGTLRLFFGRVGAVDMGRSVCTFSINAHTELLNLQLPRNLFQATCVNNLGDRACGVDLTTPAYHLDTTVSVASQAAVVVNTPSSFVAGFYDQGKVVFTSGFLEGLSATIKTMPYGGATSTATLLSYLPVAPAPGDGVNVVAGCDKSNGANGCAKFNNTLRYKGFPVIPQPVTAV